ncbi:unnamed protein product [Strongylus vulgaris]|uniref:Uncharacterized protein n=1 Tax=Strongylus vulgaris TaxID=40348 RepID=A0A3P7J512_STRVU|nr:unnamed protein product [Strongylus vulgaris]
MSSSDEDAFPVEREAAMEAIGKMIDAEGLEKLTSSKIRAHLASTFNKDFDDFRKEVDELTRETIERREKSKEAPPVNNGNGKEDERTEEPSKPAPSDSDSDTSDDVVDDRRASTKKKRSRKRKGDDVGEVDLMTAVKHCRRAAANKANQILKKTADRSRPKKKDKNAPKVDNSGKFGRMTKLCLLSEELQSIVGARFMKRCDVIAKMWEYIKTNNLLDPKDKRFFFVDDKLRSVFQCKRFRAFCMSKPLARHIKEPSLLGGEIEQEALAEEARLRAEWKARQAAANSGSGVESRTPESPQNADSPQSTGSPQDSVSPQNDTQEKATSSDEVSD